MLSRRFLRTKVLKILFSYVNSENQSLPSAEKELLASLQKTYDLYYFLLSLPEVVADYAQERIDIGLQKFHPTYEESHPNTKFVDNQVIAILRNNKAIHQYCEQHCLNWREQPAFIKKLYQHIINSDYYKSYMSSPTRSFKEDLELVININASELENNTDLESILEEMSVYWIDDTGYVLGLIIRNLESLQENVENNPELFRQKRNPEDEKFATTLLLHALMHYEEYRNLIFEFLKNWEAGRVAAMDSVLIALGIAEAKEFPNIPIKVSINEYVELAKYYSTSNSHVFVNGLLDRILQKLVSEGAIEKKGRGLLENSTPRKKKKNE